MQNQIQIAIAPIKWPTKSTNDQTELTSTMEDIKNAKFGGCELAEKFPHDPFFLQSTLKPHGLQVCGAQFNSNFTDKDKYTATVERFIDHMHFLSAVNSKKIIIREVGHGHYDMDKPMFTKQPEFSKEQWRLLIQGLTKVRNIAKEANMKIIYQPYVGTGIHTEQQISKLMEKTNKINLSLLLDTGNLSLLGISPAKLVKQYTKRVSYIYLKDVNKRLLTKAKKENLSYTQAKDLGVFTTPGKGSLNFTPLFNALKKENYQDWIVVHGMQNDNTKFSSFAKSTRKFLKLKLGI